MTTVLSDQHVPLPDPRQRFRNLNPYGTPPHTNLTEDNLSPNVLAVAVTVSWFAGWDAGLLECRLNTSVNWFGPAVTLKAPSLVPKFRLLKHSTR